MPRISEPLPAALGEVFTSAEARAAGVSKERLRRSDLESPFRRVYRRARRPSENRGDVSAHALASWKLRHLDDARALNRLIGDRDLFFCGRTAALLWGLPVPPPPGQALEIACFAPRRAPRIAGVRGVQIQPALADVRDLEGLKLTSPATTWAVLGAVLGVDDLVVLGDAILRCPRIPGTSRRERPPLGTREELEEAIGRGRRRGLPRLRAALALARDGSASPPETHMRLALLRAGLPDPELDIDVRSGDGRFLGYSEVGYRRYRVVFEYESEHHRVDRRQWNRDIEKYRDYRAEGWEPVRVTAHLLYRRPSEFGRVARNALLGAGWRPE